MDPTTAQTPPQPPYAQPGYAQPGYAQPGPPPFAGPPRAWGAAPPHGPAFAAPPVPRTRSSRLPSGAEALGWGGGLTTLLGVIAVTWDFWSQVSDLVLVGLLVTATAILGVAAAIVGDLDRAHDDRLAANLAVGLWWMTGIAASVSIFVGIDVLSGGRAYLGVLAASLAAGAMFAAAAYRTGRDGLVAGAVASGAVAAFAAASLAPLADANRALAMWGVGVVATTVVCAWQRPESRSSFTTSVLVLLAAGQAVLWTGGGTADVAVMVLGAVGVAGLALWRRSPAEGITTSVLASLLLAQVLYDLAPDVFSLSTSILVAGIAMTAGCIHLVRRSTRRERAGAPRR